MCLAKSSYLARCLVKAGTVAISVGYDLCPEGEKLVFIFFSTFNLYL